MEDPNKPEQLSSLDKFKRRLDRRGGSQSDFKSTILPPKDFGVNKAWGDDGFSSVDYAPVVAKKTNLFLWRLFWGSSIFFLVTIAVAVYVIFFSANIVSGNNIEILVKGSNQIRSGDELNLQTTIVNKNKVTLNYVNLVFNYPAGTMDPLSPNQELPVWREKIDNLNPGQTVDVASRAVIFGGQNTTRDIKITLEYRIPDSNALFTKEKIYTVTIGASSLDLALQMPAEVNIGKEFTGTLKIVSNAQSLLRNCAIRIEWPTGLSFKKSDPDPVEGDNVWFLGDLIPGAEKEISFTASLSGQNGDTKPFKILAGLASGGGKDDMVLEYGNLFQTINLRRDFVSADIFLADENGRDQAVFPGGKFSGDIAWVNNLNDNIINGSLELELEGALINKRTVRASSGFYNSLNNLISWDQRVLTGLKMIPPDEGGQTNFTFSLLPLPATPDPLGEKIKLKLIFRGTRIIGENQTEEVVTQTEKIVRVSTLSGLVANAVYSTGPFKNTGPLPPTVGEETSYTVNWAVSNDLNDLKNVTVRTILPPFVKWLGAISPLDEKIVYNQASGEVVWNLGTVSAGATATKRASFQISFTPSLSHVGKTFNLTSQVSLSGTDAITGVSVSKTVPPLSTIINTDPSFTNDQSIISE